MVMKRYTALIAFVFFSNSCSDASQQGNQPVKDEGTIAIEAQGLAPIQASDIQIIGDLGSGSDRKRYTKWVSVDGDSAGVDSEKVVQALRKECENPGQNECYVYASNTWIAERSTDYQDPAPGSVKLLHVEYECAPFAVGGPAEAHQIKVAEKREHEAGGLRIKCP